MAKARAELGVADDEAVLARFGDDFRRVSSRYSGPKAALSSGATLRTLFGVEHQGVGYGQAVAHPLAGASLADVQAYPWPDPDWMEVAHIRAEALAWKGQYAILGGNGRRTGMTPLTCWAWRTSIS